MTKIKFDILQLLFCFCVSVKSDAKSHLDISRYHTYYAIYARIYAPHIQPYYLSTYK